MTLEQWIQDIELGTEIATQIGVDISLLQAGQPASGTFVASPFGHKYNVSISFTPAT